MRSLQQQPGETGGRSRRQQFLRVLLRTLGMTAAAGALFAVTWIIQPAPCWAVFALVALTAWPLWRYRTEYLLFRRRLVLAGAVRPQSRLRQLLWRGGMTKTIQVVVSMALAWTLLALTAQLSILHWSILILDAVFLAVIATPVSRQLRGDIKATHLPIVARRWPLFLINGTVLCIAIMSIDFFAVGAQDTRHLAWHQVANQGFGGVFAAAGCTLWGASQGLLSAVEALSWHFSELIIPNLPDLSTKVIAWSFFLLRAATLAWLFTALLLGVNALLDRQGKEDKMLPAGRVFSRSFVLTVIVLALPYFYASLKMHEMPRPDIARGVSRLASSIDPCKVDEARRARLLDRLEKAVADERRMTIDEIDGRIDQQIDHLFSQVEAGIDDYLDWFFTVIGEYQRLGAVLTKDATTVMGGKLEEFLFARNAFDAQLDDLERNIERLADERFAAITPYLEAELDRAPCDIGRIALSPLVALDRDALRASTATTGGVVAGVASGKLLAKQTAAALAGKVAAKKSLHGGAALASKALAKKGTSTALSAGIGATLCAPAGPVAILCGVTAGLVAWVAVDKTLIEIDEALNRDEMRAEILSAVAAQKEQLRAQLRQKHHARVDGHAARVNDAVRRSFVPYRDGIGR